MVPVLNPYYKNTGQFGTFFENIFDYLRNKK